MIEYSLLLFKPNAYYENMTNHILNMFKENGLDIIYHKKITLTEQMILDYQPILGRLPKKIQDIYIRIYTSHYTDVYIMSGEGAISKTHKIKKNIRENFVGMHCNTIPYNLVHTTDNNEELLNNISILIPEKLEFIEKSIKD